MDNGQSLNLGQLDPHSSDSEKGINTEIPEPERDARGIGSKATEANRMGATEPVSDLIPGSDSGMGEVIDLAMPPGVPNTKEQSEEPTPDKIAEKAMKFDNIRTGERLNPKGVGEVQRAINEIKYDNIADFYDKVREMTKDHLDNSFGRKIPS